jgi:hypothetical protein
MHRLTTTFVLGYHGCDESVAAKLVAGEAFVPSRNDYDWLGDGIYFWEANPRRGLEFAEEVRAREGQRTTIGTPAVVGAVIDLRLCLDLSTSPGAMEVKGAYKSLESVMRSAGQPMPANRGGRDLVLRDLDRAVIEHLHAVRRGDGLPEIDTVRAFYFEGDRLFPDAGFFEKTHVQICVRHPDCIHGVFRVPAADLTS